MRASVETSAPQPIGLSPATRVTRQPASAGVNRLFTVVALAATYLGGGCAEVVKSSPDEVSVETQFLGDIMPGARHWLGWLAANQQCGALGRSPEVKDLQGSIATYRCVED